MELHEGLTARTEGCSALLMDRGNGSPDVPTCMGAISIEGACSTIVGCVDYDNCRNKITPISGKVRVAHLDEEGVVAQETIVSTRPLVR